MPRKLAGHTHVTVEIPDEILARANAKRGKESLTAMVCRLLAREVGAKYIPPARGRPKIISEGRREVRQKSAE